MRRWNWARKSIDMAPRTSGTGPYLCSDWCGVRTGMDKVRSVHGQRSNLSIYLINMPIRNWTHSGSIHLLGQAQVWWIIVSIKKNTTLCPSRVVAIESLHHMHFLCLPKVVSNLYSDTWTGIYIQKLHFKQLSMIHKHLWKTTTGYVRTHDTCPLWWSEYVGDNDPDY